MNVDKQMQIDTDDVQLTGLCGPQGLSTTIAWWNGQWSMVLFCSARKGRLHKQSRDEAGDIDDAEDGTQPTLSSGADTLEGDTHCHRQSLLVYRRLLNSG
jgi:hypothetical protein